jgi:cathepsin A (carboxypeptidase C)
MLTTSATTVRDIPTVNYCFANFVTVGNKAWTNVLEWPGKNDFNKAPEEDLKLPGGKKTGVVKSSGNFTFMEIYAAGHMVPMDQPEASLDFYNRWLDGEWM